jgi:hypothetical protein
MHLSNVFFLNFFFFFARKHKKNSENRQLKGNFGITTEKMRFFSIEKHKIQRKKTRFSIKKPPKTAKKKKENGESESKSNKINQKKTEFTMKECSKNPQNGQFFLNFNEN